MMNLKMIRQEAKASLKGNWGLAIGAGIVSAIIPWVIVAFITPIFGRLLGPMVEMTLDLVVNLIVGGVLTAGLAWIFLGIIDRKPVDISNLFDSFKNLGRVIGTQFLVGLFAFLWMIPVAIVAGLLMGAIIVVLSIVESLVLAIILFTMWMLCYLGAAYLILARYAFVLYLIKDYPYIRPMEAIQESKELMRGHTVKYFSQQVFFFLWQLPGVFAVVVSIGIILYEVFWLFANNPLMPMQLMVGNFNFATDIVQSLLLAVLLLVIGAGYLFGIGLYVTPYRHAANATFYRHLKAKPEDNNFSTVIAGGYEDNGFEFANNTPPKERFEPKTDSDSFLGAFED